MPTFLKNVLLFILISCFYAMSYLGLQSHRTSISQTKIQPISSLQTLPPVILKILAGEFKGLAADMMLFDIGSRLGTEIVRNKGKWTTIQKSHDWNIIHKLFVNCQALDPHFQQTFLLAQGWLPWNAEMVKETGEILQIAAENRPWDWEPLRYLGFNSYYFNNDMGKAGTLYLQAAQVPNSPPFLSVLGGRLALKGGETETAILLLENILEHSTHTDSENQNIIDRYHALQGALVIENAIHSYRNKYGAIPTAPEILVEKGILKTLPNNPYDTSYCIDQSGKVYFDNLNCTNN